MRATVSDEILNREGCIIGNLAVALETLTGKYVEFSIVGNINDSALKALLDAARNVYESRKILHYEKPGRYPELERPALYICNPTSCSVLIFNPQDILKHAEQFVPITLLPNARRTSCTPYLISFSEFFPDYSNQ